MARAKTKEELITASTEQYNKLWELINSMTKEEQEATFVFEDRDRNIRDVLVHLYEWHQLLLKWVKANQNGDNKPFLPEPYNWKTYGTMNVEMIWEKHQKTPYETSKKILEESHKAVMELLNNFTNDELFTKKYFPWTGTTNVGSYFISVTSSHYDWAIKKIKKQIKESKIKSL